MKPRTNEEIHLPMGAREISQALIELAPDFVALLDRDRTVKYVSPAVRDVTGYAPDELIGRQFGGLAVIEDVERAEAVFAKSLASRKTVTAQIRLRRKDGTVITLETLARNYLELPELQGILVSCRDISGHVELEATLRKTARESAELFENAPCGYHSVDSRGVFRRVNGTELRMLQRSRDELVGKARFADFLAPDSQSAYWREFEHLKAAGAVRNVEFDVLRKDATSFPGLLQSVAVFEKGGRFVESRTTVYDIAERRRAEHALQKVNRALRVLSEAREQIITARSEASLLEAICRILIEERGYCLAAVHFVQHDAASSMKLVAKAGAAKEYFPEAVVTWADGERGRGPIGRAVRTGEPQVSQHLLADPSMAPWHDLARRYGFQSETTAPIKDDSGVFATLSVFAGEPDAFDPEECSLIEELAADLGFGLGSLLAQKFAAEHAALKGPGGKEKASPLALLSAREREVLKLVVEGHSGKEIARVLSIAPASVFTYRSRIMFKLGIKDVTGLVRFAIRNGIIEP